MTDTTSLSPRVPGNSKLRRPLVLAFAAVALLASACGVQRDDQLDSSSQGLSLFTSTPTAFATADSSSINLGVKFKASVDGTVSGIRFYKGTGNTGTHVGNLWTSSGQLLASATFTNETTTGWQTARFSQPVSIQANTVYVASYLAPNGHYAGESGFFATSGYTAGPLYALKDGEMGGNGVFLRAATPTFPTSSSNANNYSVDVLFDPVAPAGHGLTGEYFDNIDLTGSKFTRVDPVVDFDWSTGSPDPRIGPDTFSVRWTGQVLAPSSAVYVFSTNSDDGARLWIDGRLLIDNWTRHATTTNSGKISLTAGKHDLKLEYFEDAGYAVIGLKWRVAKGSTVTIPSANLFPASVPACTPVCSGKQCGADGCGGTCGTCATGTSCNASNQCVSSACVPLCSGKACGDDSCGGSCGTCGSGMTCNSTNQCVAPSCVPACSGKACGSDGCGGNCGTCASGTTCNASGLCVAPTCTPSCSGKTCGADGCGGTCGTCGSGTTCSATGTCTAVAPTGQQWFRFASENPGSNPSPWADTLVTKLGFNGFGFWGPFSSTTQSWVANHSYNQVAWMPATNRNMASYNYTYDPAKISSHESMLRTLTQGSSDPNKIFWDGMPEWDQGGGDWSSGRPAVTSSLTRQQNYDNFKNFYLNTLGLSSTLGVPRASRGYNFAAVSDYPWTAHWVLEWGADLVMGERIIDELSGIAPGNSFYRGAAKQFGKAWGNDMSTWRYWTSSPTEYDTSDHLTGGWSASWFKRHLYASYMGGANVIHMEPATYINSATNGLNPLGVVVQQFANFALTRHPNRPPTHVPFALVVDKYSGFDPKFGQYIQGNAVMYSKIPYAPGDYFLANIFKTAYPDYNLHGTLVSGGPQSVTEYRSRLAAGEDPRPWEPMSKSHWGDVFDVLNNTTTAAGLANYKVAMMVTEIPVDATLRAQYQQYVQNGGVLILNAAQVTSADTALTGVALTGQTGTSTSSTWLADGSSNAEASYTYSKVTLQGATVVAKNNEGDPLITRFNVGAGQVYLTTPTLLQDSNKSGLLKIGQKLIGSLLDQVAPAKVSGSDILYELNTNGSTTTVTLINGGGSTWNGTLSFPTPSGTFKTTEWTADTAVANSAANGTVNVSASVPPYDVRVYAIEKTP